jgi:prepilin-type N-terminal cleavage/methylation domain-containing protein
MFASGSTPRLHTPPPPAGGRCERSNGGVSATRSSPNPIIGGDDPARRRDAPAARPWPGPHSPRGFTLTEILVVVALIVLLIALAVPTFNVITGSRSVEAAQNNISAFLGRARSEAIGLQEVRGVFFYIERRSGNIGMAIVREVDAPPSSDFSPAAPLAEPPPDVWLDLVPESEFVMLPSGVGVHTIDDAMINNSGVRIDDAYIGFNRRNAGNSTGGGTQTRTFYGGVILFDGSGQLTCRRYAFKTFFRVPPGLTERRPTRMGDLLFRPTGDIDPLTGHATSVNDVVPLALPPGGAVTNPYYAKSQIGLVLFDRESMRGAVARNPATPQDEDSRDLDWQFSPSVGAYNQNAPYDEASKERWLDDNAVPLLVNRYNGTLVRGE